MIEGEEIFESAHETGYRLCRNISTAQSTEPELVFSASWDLNLPNRLHVCLQNGQLKVFDVDSHACSRFNILFRRYTPVFENDTKSEKVETKHWDKMTTIPDRPDEIIFLHGIARVLMYTALPPPEDEPYPDKPLLASTARGDFPGFIFGSPVMEISTHPARITSLCVSPAGHILASGDEHGNVRLLLLRLLDEISVFKQNERRRKKHTAATTFSKFLPTYNICVPAHQGPIFTMQWLPIMSCSESNNVRNYALVTGSVDRSVRIWRISCCTHTGITMTHAMNLDTLSTHVMSLSSYLYTDRFLLAKNSRVEGFSKTLNMNMHESFISQFSYNTQEEHNEKKKVNTVNAARSIFLAAGTDVGTVYVWKINFLEVMSAIESLPELLPRSPSSSPRHAPPPAAVPDNRIVISDDGTKLYSLMQTSDRPIIHLSINAFPSDGVPLSPSNGNSFKSRQDLLDFANASAGDVVLAASDTQGTVHIYAPEKLDKQSTTTPRATGAVQALAELPHHPLYDEYRSRLQAEDEDVHQRFHTPLVRIGEQRFPAAVVACAFPPAYPQEELLNSLGTPGKSVTYAPRLLADRWDPTEMSQRTGPLLVSNAKGDLILYSVQDLGALAQQYKRDMDATHDTVTLANLASHNGARGVGFGARRRRDEDSASECSVDSDVRDSDRKLFAHRTDRKIAQMSAVDFLAGEATYVSESEDSRDSRDDLLEQVTKKPRSPLKFASGSGGSGTGSGPGLRGRTESDTTKATRVNTQTNAKLTAMNSSPPSAQSAAATAKPTANPAKAKKSTVWQKEEEEGSEYPRARPPLPTASIPSPSALPARPSPTEIQGGVVRHNSGSGNGSGRDKPSLNIQTQPKNAKYTAWDSPESSPSTSPSRNPHTGMYSFDGVRGDNYSTYSASEPSTPLPSPPKNFKKKVHAAEVDVRENPLAKPEVTYTKLLEGKVNELQQVIDNDEFSVSTQLTTKSDLVAAAAAARAAVHRQRRYGGLTPMQYLDGADMSMLLHEAGLGSTGREKSKIGKQVDPAWLANRKFNGPTAEDMALLDIPDPLVSLRLSHCNAHLRHPSAKPSSASAASAAAKNVLQGPSVVNQSTAESVRTERTAAGPGAGVKTVVQEYAYNAEFGLRHSTDPQTLTMKYRVEVNMDQVFGRFDPPAAARRLQPVRDAWTQNNLLDLCSSPSSY